MTPDFTPAFSVMASFILGYLTCALWHFYLECREHWRKDNE